MFCRFCGNQVRDEAYICPSCGRELKEIPAEITMPHVRVERPRKPRGKAKLQRLCRTFSTLGIAFNAAGFGLMLLQVLGWVLLFIGTSQPVYNEAVEACLVLAMFCGYFGFIFSIIFVGLGADFATGAFILGLIQKEDKELKRRAIGVFVGGMVLLVVWIFSFMFSIVFLSMAGASV